MQVRRDPLPKFSFYFLEYFQNKVKFPNQILPGHRENIIWHVTVHPALCQIWCYLNNARWINGPQVANWDWRTCMIDSNRTSNYETRLVDKDCLLPRLSDALVRGSMFSRRAKKSLARVFAEKLSTLAGWFWAHEKESSTLVPALPGQSQWGRE